MLVTIHYWENIITPISAGEGTETRAAHSCPESHGRCPAELSRESRRSSEATPLKLPEEDHSATYHHWLGAHWCFTHNIPMDSHHSPASKWEGQGDGGGQALQPGSLPGPAALGTSTLPLPAPAPPKCPLANRPHRAGGNKELQQRRPHSCQRQPTPTPRKLQANF